MEFTFQWPQEVLAGCPSQRGLNVQELNVESQNFSGMLDKQLNPGSSQDSWSYGHTSSNCRGKAFTHFARMFLAKYLPCRNIDKIIQSPKFVDHVTAQEANKLFCTPTCMMS